MLPADRKGSYPMSYCYYHIEFNRTLLLYRGITTSYFHISADYIITQHSTRYWGTPLRLSITYSLLSLTEIVVEVFSIRDLPADFPFYFVYLGFNLVNIQQLFYTFVTTTHRHISFFCFGMLALGGFSISMCHFFGLISQSVY
jgi:hypothetical protein